MLERAAAGHGGEDLPQRGARGLRDSGVGPHYDATWNLLQFCFFVGSPFCCTEADSISQSPDPETEF